MWLLCYCKLVLVHNNEVKKNCVSHCVHMRHSVYTVCHSVCCLLLCRWADLMKVGGTNPVAEHGFNHPFVQVSTRCFDFELAVVMMQYLFSKHCIA